MLASLLATAAAGFDASLALAAAESSSPTFAMPRPPAPTSTPGTLLLASGTAPTAPHVVDTTTTLVVRASDHHRKSSGSCGHLVRLTLHVRHAPAGAAVPAPHTTAAILASSPATLTTTAPGAALATAFPPGTSLHDSSRSATDDAVQTVTITWGQPLSPPVPLANDPAPRSHPRSRSRSRSHGAADSGTDDLDPLCPPPTAVIAAYPVPASPTFGTGTASGVTDGDLRHVEAMHVALIHGGDAADDDDQVAVLFTLQWAWSSTGLFRASPGLGTVHRHYDAVRKAAVEYWLEFADRPPTPPAPKLHVDAQVAALKTDLAAVKSAFRHHAALPRAFTPAPELRYLRRVHVAAHLATITLNTPLPDGAAAIDVAWRLDVPEGWAFDEVPAAGAPRVVGGPSTQVLAGRAVVAVAGNARGWWTWWWWVAWIAPLVAWLVGWSAAATRGGEEEVAVAVPAEWTLVQKSKLASPLVLHVSAHALVTDPTDSARRAARHLVGTGSVRIATDQPGRVDARCRLARPRFPPHVRVVEWVLGTPAMAEMDVAKVPPLVEAVLHAMGANANSGSGETHGAASPPTARSTSGRKHRRAQSDAVAAMSSPTTTTLVSTCAAVSHPALHAVAESPTTATARPDRTAATLHRRHGHAFPTTPTATVSVLVDTAWHVAASASSDPLAHARARVLALRAWRLTRCPRRGGRACGRAGRHGTG
ncbi:hypothetical protein GGF32_003640 [Allomyces javanicus]|nr:hypothetical protein GGF32_003640 [Allomyces javanicus]